MFDRYIEIGAVMIVLALLVGCEKIEPTAEPPILGDAQTRSTDGMVMVYVPGGEFQMGSDADEASYALDLCKEYIGGLVTATCQRESFKNEQPAHAVILDGFWIDRTEVTNKQYQQCVQAGDCAPPVESGSHTRDSYYGDSAYDDYPVIWVRWDQAADYCAWAGGRLPTEAEWEYAARGTEGRLFPWGDTFDGTRLNYCDVDCDGVNDETVNDGYPDTAPVGSFPAGVSWCGALDMAGNVREWVADWFEYYSPERQVNPTGPPAGDSRIPRGGSWYDMPDDVRSANRGENSPDYTRHKVGFRCASSVFPTATSTTAPPPTPVPPTATPPPPTPTPVPPTATSPPSTPAPSEMVYIPAGEFIMGSEEGRDNEQPAHTVYLDAFYIDQTEVTNAQFAQFLNERGNQKEEGETWLDIGDEDCRIIRRGTQYQPWSDYQDHPVLEVTWYGAEAYCEWTGGRLPTEAEWEKAASWDPATDTKRVYPWGDEWDESRVNADRPITTTVEIGIHTVPVGSKSKGASPYGVMDMAGNVWEWVADWYAEDYYERSLSQNPQGSGPGECTVLGPNTQDVHECKVLRGGSWRSTASFVRTTVRHYVFPTFSFDVGFRCVQE